MARPASPADGLTGAPASAGSRGAPAERVLEVQGLTVRYGSRLATFGVDLDQAAGEVLGLVGESGAGKSSVARAVAGLLPEGGRVEAGRIRLEGRDLGELSREALRRLRGSAIALVTQDPLSALNPAFRIGLQATDALCLHRGLSRRAAAGEMVQLLRHLGLPDPVDVLGRFPHELSGGMRQRVLLAMAFSCAPRLLLADEPTTALDVTTQAQILRLLATLRAEHRTAVLFVTHDLGVVAHLADRVAVMLAGCVVEVASTAALFRSPAHPYTAALLAQAPRVEASVDLGDEGPLGGGDLVPGLEGPPAACPFRARCSRRHDRCDEAMPPLVSTAPGRQVACWDPLGT